MCLNQTYINVQEPGWLNGIALGYELDDRGFESLQGLEIFLYTTASSLLFNGYRGVFPWR
jgi:hypothetical protein